MGGGRWARGLRYSVWNTKTQFKNPYYDNEVIKNVQSTLEHDLSNETSSNIYFCTWRSIK